jgi:hypothetical protein
MDPDEMRLRASRYRDLARRITDEITIKALNGLADEYEARAEGQQGHDGRHVGDEQKDCGPSS